eukprot:2212293-Pyramimonas_sp.AAC.2
MGLGIRCPESLYTRVAELTSPGAPCYFVHGTKWVNVPNVLHVGLSCRADGTGGGRGRQCVHGCPCLPGDNRSQSCLRIDSELLGMVSLKNLLRDSISVRRSVNDVIMTAGWEGGVPPSHNDQLIGILPNRTQCRHDRVGQVWINLLYIEDTSGATCVRPIFPHSSIAKLRAMHRREGIGRCRRLPIT